MINMADVLPTTTKEQRALELVKEFIKQKDSNECTLPGDKVDCPNNLSCWQCWAGYMKKELKKYDK